MHDLIAVLVNILKLSMVVLCGSLIGLEGSENTKKKC